MSSDPANVDALFACARNGDQCAMETLLRKLQPDLRRYARRSCSSSDIDEAVQDAMWIIYQRAGALRFVAALSSWLFKIVLRICLRMKKRAAETEEFDEENLAHTSDSQQEVANLRLDLATVLSRLDRHQREVLLMRDVFGYSAEETALQLNISVQASKSRLHRARSTVRQQLICLDTH
ncbi:MAG: sigma-70 family RNA polymerase sigma factor [Pseudomonadota bacterium]